MFYTENENSVTLQQRTSDPSRVLLHTEPVERKMVPLSLLFLHEKRCVVHVSVKGSENHQWWMGMPVFALSGSTGQLHLCLVLFVGCSRPVVPGRQRRNRAPFIGGCCFHPLPRGKWYVGCFGGGFVWFKGCVPMCLCYKRQVGWRAG